jgi:hypothetical protein
MSTGRYSQRGWAFQSFAFRTWGLAGAGEDAAATDPVSGWTAQTAKRHFVSTSASRLGITSPQDRVWVARAENG